MSFYRKDPLPTTLTSLSSISNDLSDGAGKTLQSAIRTITVFQEDLKANPEDYKAYPFCDIAASFLYSMMDYAPVPSARQRIANEIVTSGLSGCTVERNTKLLRIAAYYIHYLIQPLKSRKVTSPVSSTVPSHLSFTPHQKDILRHFTPGKRSNIKVKALQRDDYRCLLTGTVDIDHLVKSNGTLQQGEVPGCTKAAHIIPFHLVAFDAVDEKAHKMQDTNTNSPLVDSKTDGKAGTPQDGPAGLDKASTPYCAWFGNLEREDLEGRNINRLDNIMTLTYDIHAYFEDLKLWAEQGQDSANRYTVQAIHTNYLFHIKKGGEVQFSTLDVETMPLPNPNYLVLHAACAKIAYISGVGKLLDDLERQGEDLNVLASDGSSMALLQYKLAAAAAISGFWPPERTDHFIVPYGE
ncbi:hypothetical protein FRC17_010517 [Serendipita sp. 399]|nr:hypothetical protein FRC17_010517 [Serendipita sp. 399]